MNHSLKISGYCFILSAVVFFSCSKEDEVNLSDPPIVITSDINMIQRTKAQCGGRMISVGSSPVTAFGVCWNTTGNPTVNDNLTSDGKVPELYWTYLHPLIPNTLYYVRAYATNGSGTGYGTERKFTTIPASTGIIFNDDLTYGTISDIEGNVYKTIIIGTQTWMAENLRTTKYTDNTEIDLITDDGKWGNLETPGYCWYENNEHLYADIYGAYYNWLVVYTSRLCPTGWHVPSDDEWKTLEMNLGMSKEQADAEDSRGISEGAGIKEAGTNNWIPGGSVGTNESGLTGLPGGLRTSFVGAFEDEGLTCNWWTSTGYYPIGGIAYYRSLSYSSSRIGRNLKNIKGGLNVRCIKD